MLVEDLENVMAHDGFNEHEVDVEGEDALREMEQAEEASRCAA